MFILNAQHAMASRQPAASTTRFGSSDGASPSFDAGPFHPDAMPVADRLFLQFGIPVVATLTESNPLLFGREYSLAERVLEAADKITPAMMKLHPDKRPGFKKLLGLVKQPASNPRMRSNVSGEATATTALAVRDLKALFLNVPRTITPIKQRVVKGVPVIDFELKHAGEPHDFKKGPLVGRASFFVEATQENPKNSHVQITLKQNRLGQTEITRTDVLMAGTSSDPRIPNQRPFIIHQRRDYQTGILMTSPKARNVLSDVTGQLASTPNRLTQTFYFPPQGFMPGAAGSIKLPEGDNAPGRLKLRLIAEKPPSGRAHKTKTVYDGPAFPTFSN